VGVKKLKEAANNTVFYGILAYFNKFPRSLIKALKEG